MYRVLIVEDDPMVAMIHEQYVSRNKEFCVAGKCRDGSSALAYLEKNSADLLILDVYMPHTDGFELLRKIREKQITVDVIMVTAANDRISLEEAIRLGVIDYLVKPFAYERFQTALGKFIAQTNALRGIETLSQQSIDYIIDNSAKANQSAYPKGIQEKTLNKIMDFLKSSEDVWFTGEVITEKVGLSAVTVRRYMNHLAATGVVSAKMNYETGGRPCMLYRIEK